MTETYIEAGPKHRWRDPKPVWRAVALLFCSAIIVYALFAVYGALVVMQAQYWLAPNLAETADSLFLILNRIATPLFLICAASTLLLTYILIANAHTFEPSTKLTSPGPAIASYFIPLICLFMPPAMMGQLWRATFGPSGREPQGVIALWWSAFVIAALVGTWARIADSTSNAGHSEILFGVQMLGFISRIIAAVTLMYIFSSIVSQQMLHQRSRSLAG